MSREELTSGHQIAQEHVKGRAQKAPNSGQRPELEHRAT